MTAQKSGNLNVSVFFFYFHKNVQRDNAVETHGPETITDVILAPTTDNGFNEHNTLPLQKSNSQECNILCVRFENFTVVTMKITAFWLLTPCSWVDRYMSHEHTASIFKVEE